MPTEEERIAADEARIAALAGGGPDDAPGDDNDETMSSSTVPEDDDDNAPTDEEIRAANEAGEQSDTDADPEPDPDAEPEPEAGTAAPGATTFQRRISQLAGDKRTLKQQLADAQAEVARLRAGQQADPPVDPAAEPGGDAPQRRNFSTQAEFDAAVAAEASRRAAVSAFNSRCNDVEEKGSKSFGKAWSAAKEALSLLDDEGTIPSDLLLPALETENPHRVLLALGQDPDLAARLLAMNPTKRAMEIARMDLPAAPTPPRRSNAPPPVDPIRGRAAPASSSALPSDKDSDAEWLKKRNAQVAAREAARRAG